MGPRAVARRTRSSAFPRGDVEQLHHPLCRPDNAIVALTRDIASTQATALALASFGGWRSPTAAVASGRSALPDLRGTNPPDTGRAGLCLAEIGRYIDRVQRMKPAQIERYAQAHLGDDAGRWWWSAMPPFGAALLKVHPEGRQLSAQSMELDHASLQAAEAAGTRRSSPSA